METILEGKDLAMQLNRISSVSIYMITYNHCEYIEQSIESVMMQRTDFPIHLFIGVDCSTDSTRTICEKLKEKYPSLITLDLNTENIGAKRNAINTFNLCFDSEGKYIALCEGDDYWTDPLKLQKQVDFMEANPDYNICFHEVGVFNQTEGILQKNTITRKVAETTTIEELANGNYIHTPSVLFRNNFTLPKWFQESPTGDWTLYMIMAKDGKIKKLPEIMAVYRQHGGGVWSGKSQLTRMNMTLKTFKLVYKNVKLPPIAKQNLKERIRVLKKDRLVVKRKGSKIHQFKLKIRSLFKGLKRRLP